METLEDTLRTNPECRRLPKKEKLGVQFAEDMGSETEKEWDLSSSGRPTNARTRAQPLGASAELEPRLQDGREAGPSSSLQTRSGTRSLSSSAVQAVGSFGEHSTRQA